MTRALYLAIFAPVLPVLAPAMSELATNPGGAPAGDGGKKQQVVAVAPPPRATWKNPLETGTVTAIDGSSITIQGYSILVKGVTHSEFGWKERRRTVTQTGNPLVITGTFPPMTGVRLFSDGWGTTTVSHADGTKTVIRRDEQPHRRYPLSDALKAGWYGDGFGGSYTYRLADVRIGDIVDLRLLKSFYEPPVCMAIMIWRRPGGRVPPPAGDPLVLRPRKPTDPPLPYERANAMQDWEERGIPIPLRFLSPQERRERTAPPPRAVNAAAIPPAKP